MMRGYLKELGGGVGPAVMESLMLGCQTSTEDCHQMENTEEGRTAAERGGGRD